MRVSGPSETGRSVSSYAPGAGAKADSLSSTSVDRSEHRSRNLEHEVDELRSEIVELREALADLRRQLGD